MTTKTIDYSLIEKWTVWIHSGPTGDFAFETAEYEEAVFISACIMANAPELEVELPLGIIQYDRSFNIGEIDNLPDPRQFPEPNEGSNIL